MSAIFCWAAGGQDLTFRFSASQAPLFSFMLPVSHQCLWGQPHDPMENLRMEHIAKNKANFSLKPRKVINPRIPLPSPLTAPSCHTHSCLLQPMRPVWGNWWLGKKKRRLSHEVIPLSHFYSSAFSHCLQLSLFYSCTWLLRLWSSPLLHILWCILAYIVCNLTPCHLIPPTSHNPYQPLSPPFHLSFV